MHFSVDDTPLSAHPRCITQLIVIGLGMIVATTIIRDMGVLQARWKYI